MATSSQSEFEFNDLPGQPQVAFDKLQCNILRGTPRRRATHVFRRFRSAQDLARYFLQAAPAPSSAEANTPILVNLFLTMAALDWLGIDRGAPVDPAFARGTRDPATTAKIRDGTLTAWREHERPWHVVEVYAHEPGVDVPVAHTDDYVIERGGGINKEGNLLEPNDDLTSYGHFRIRDGISKQVYTQEDYQKINGKGVQHWDPRQQWSTLLVADFLAPSDRSAFGSYFVFRKYAQDRQVFDARIAAIAQEVERRRKEKQTTGRPTFPPEDRGHKVFAEKRSPELEDVAKAWLFGRDANGVTVFGKSGNDFNYDDNRQGEKCPFHAHIRKMNPRSPVGSKEAIRERKKLIARRGTSYVSTENGRERREETGLLFWSAQASIGEQFEYIQEKWANGSNVDTDIEPHPDVDSVIGRLEERLGPDAAGGPGPWSKWKDSFDFDDNVWDSIELRGAEYCYAPSLPGYEALKGRAERLLADLAKAPPASLLSLLYHMYVPHYRDEFHADDENSFARFGINQLPHGWAADVKSAARGVATASYEMRKGTRQASGATSKALFDSLAQVLAEEIAAGILARPVEPQLVRADLLGALFGLCYFESCRSGPVPAEAVENGLQAEWEIVRSALLKPPSSSESIKPAVQRICDVLSRTFDGAYFLIVW